MIPHQQDNQANEMQLSEYDVSDDAAYEWLLSDHPWAVAERKRRWAAHEEAELARAAQVREWADRTRAAEAAGELGDRPDDWRTNLVRLAEGLRLVADQTHLSTSVDSAEPADVRVARLRSEWEVHRQVADHHDYRYPAHLLGPGAAAYPPPSAGERFTRSPSATTTPKQTHERNPPAGPADPRQAKAVTAPQPT